MAVELQQMHSVNPATEERIGTYPVHSEREVDAALDAAAAAASRLARHHRSPTAARWSRGSASCCSSAATRSRP